jgi:hypothetical protein
VWEESDDATAAYAAFFLWLTLGSWPALQGLGLAGAKQQQPSCCPGWHLLFALQQQ